MEKLKAAIADLKGINTNDPILQGRIVKVFDELIIVLEGKLSTDEVISKQESMNRLMSYKGGLCGGRY